MKKEYNILILKALRFFIENPYEEIHLREFSRKLKISVNSAQRFLDFFLKERLINEERKANLRSFKANIDSIVFRNLKIVFSLKKIEDSGIVNLLRNRVFNFVLFGSIAKGTDSAESDIDLLVLCRDREEIRKICSDFHKKFNREVNFHIFNVNQWKNQKKLNKAFYQEVISTGINLIGETPILD
ncbi:MAG: nucleotidyltransferase domain-containing protein [Nanoarchaeota archaeon]|nr:nucleotidyltransferase domain-containing protein [Nanoarchaeota archaeon]MBU1027537.1 nucleotidyltransferase domain-containing protein [Nanoarchaeota archaeon]